MFQGSASAAATLIDQVIKPFHWGRCDIAAKPVLYTLKQRATHGPFLKVVVLGLIAHHLCPDLNRAWRSGDGKRSALPPLDPPRENNRLHHSRIYLLAVLLCRPSCLKAACLYYQLKCVIIIVLLIDQVFVAQQSVALVA
jgi:hypothetical protein